MNLGKGRVTFDSLQSFLADLSSNLRFKTEEIKNNVENIEDKNDDVTEARAMIRTMLNEPKNILWTRKLESILYPKAFA